ncbi:MAG: hypothetical protein JSW52_10565 [Candidatus Coatesbacteria bacterium]|nr:MAG: hypothetical protein JSW52_10565 [Candidatus Coatesbacteria bacterium]
MAIKQIVEVESVFDESENDYAILLAVAKKAREVLDDYPRYGALLERYKPTTIALSEYADGAFALKESDEEDE